MISRMPSVEPSSMKMISSILRVCSASDLMHLSMASASLWPAMTMLIVSLSSARFSSTFGTRFPPKLATKIAIPDRV